MIQPIKISYSLTSLVLIILALEGCAFSDPCDGCLGFPSADISIRVSDTSGKNLFINPGSYYSENDFKIYHLDQEGNRELANNYVFLDSSFWYSMNLNYENFIIVISDTMTYEFELKGEGKSWGGECPQCYTGKLTAIHYNGTQICNSEDCLIELIVDLKK